jgi:hypothetical protein
VRKPSPSEALLLERAGFGSPKPELEGGSDEAILPHFIAYHEKFSNNLGVAMPPGISRDDRDPQVNAPRRGERILVILGTFVRNGGTFSG